MGKGSSGSNTTVQNNAPPQQFMDAYTQAVGNAQNLAAQPFQQYQGNLQAGLSPDQLAAIGNIQSAQGVASPYINSAAQYINNATTPLAPSLQPYFAAQNNAVNAQGTLAGDVQKNLSGFLGMSNQDAGQQLGVAQSAQGTVSPFQQLGSSQINQYLNPYLSQVVGATQAQFNNQNSQQANQLAGNAVSAGAYGGDREALAQSSLANQQQLAQAPVIAGLESQGYGQAVQTAQQQQQAQLANQQAQLQGLGLAGGLYGQAAQNALQQGAMGMQGAQVAGGLYQNIAQAMAQQGQMNLGANEANAWLNSQAGAGMANLGNEALNSTLTGANALMGAGSLEQQQAQQSLNIPYEQFIAQQSWPFQTAGWEANIAEGLGANAGGTGRTTTPGPSVGSQILGTGLATAGLLGQTGAFGNSGWMTGAGAGAGAIDAGTFDAGLGAADAASGAIDTASSFAARGGHIPHRALGGGMGQPIALPQGMPNVPDVSMSIVPQGSPSHGGMNVLKNFGSTSTTTGGGPSGGQQAMQGIGDAIRVAGIIAAFDRGGHIAHRASGGSAPVSVTLKPGSYAGSPQVPVLSNGGGGMGPPAGGTPQGLSDYLSSTAASAHPPPAAPAPAMSAPAPAASPGGAPGAAPGSLGPTALSTLGIGPNQILDQSQINALANYYQATGTPGGEIFSPTGNGGSMARGGLIHHRDDGGGLPMPDDDPTFSSMRERYMAGMPEHQPIDLGSTRDKSLPLPPPPHRSAPRQEAHAGNGPPPPPPPMGAMGDSAPIFAADAEPMGGMGAGDVQRSLSYGAGIGTPPPSGPAPSHHGDPWQSLLYAGLGIMGGNSPHAGVNIGRGALQGLQAASRERRDDAYEQHQEESERQTAIRLANEADYHKQQLQQQDKHLSAQQEHWKAEEGNQSAMLPIHQGQLENSQGQLANQRDRTELEKLQKGMDLYKLQHPPGQSGGTWSTGFGPNGESGFVYRPKDGSPPIFHSDINPTANASLQQRTQNQADQLALRKQIAASTHDDKERALINNTDMQVLRSAGNIRSVNPEIKWEKAIDMATKGLGTVQSNVQPPPSSLPAQGEQQASPAIPAAPQGVPPGSAYSPSRQMWRGPDGKIYDAQGQPVS